MQIMGFMLQFLYIYSNYLNMYQIMALITTLMKFQNNRHSLSITIFTLLILFSCGRGGEIEPGPLISVDLSSKLTISTAVYGPGGTISDSQNSVSSGQSVKITATPDQHYQLKEWRGDCDSFSKDDLEITFTALKSCNVTAEFEKISYAITATSKGGGSLSGGELSREEGQTAAFTAEPQEGYQFSEWKVGEDSDCPTIADTSNPKVTFVVVGDCSLEAIFVKAPRTITTIADEGGFLTSNGELIETLIVDHGDEVEIIATNEDHYALKNWESTCGDFGDGQLTIMFTAEKDCTIKAVFEKVNYSIAVSSTEGGGVSDEGELSREYGQKVSLNIEPDEGYEFSGWKTSDCTTLEDTSNPKAEFIVGGDCSLVAEFSKALHRITTISNEGGEIAATETSEYGDEVGITATAKEHYQLKRWQGTCGDFNAESFTITISVEEDCTIEAVFEKVSYNILLSSTDGGSVSDEGELSIEHGLSVTLTATSEDGYEFSGWTLAEDAGCPSLEDASSPTLEFVVKGDCQLQAVFEKKIHTIGVTSSDGGSVSDTELVETYDQSVTLTATSEDGYEFSGWTLLEETGCPKLEDASSPTLEFVVKGDCQLQANFTPIPRTITTSADEGGKITDTQIVNHGDEVMIEVTVDEHYEFSGWEGTCGEFSSEKTSINFTVSKDCGIKAKIKKVLYTITIEAGAGGDVDPVKKEIGFGESFEITAQPEKDYVLDRWSLSGSGCPEIFDNIYDYPILKVEGDCNLKASFKYKKEATAPDVVSPTPSLEAEGVISIFSDAYTDVEGTEFDPNWGQQTVATIEELVERDSVLKYANLNYQGTSFESPIDLSSKASLHLDYWVSNSNSLDIYLINSQLITGGDPDEKPYQLDLSLQSQWVSVDIPLSRFADMVDISKVDQLKVEGDGTVYFDNIYFHGQGENSEDSNDDDQGASTSNSNEAAPIPKHASDMVISIFSDAYTDVQGTGFNPNWGQQTVATIEQLVDGDSVLKYANLNYQGTQFSGPVDVSSLTHLHIDYWVLESTALNFFLINSSNITGADPAEKAFVLELASQKQWLSVDIPLSHFSGVVDLSMVDQLKVDGDGTVYFDNIYFYKISEPQEAVSEPGHASDRVISIFSDAYTDVQGTVFNPNWGQQTVATIEQLVNVGSVLKYANLNYQGTQFSGPVDVSSSTHLHIDYWVLESTALNFFLINSANITGADPAEKAFVLELDSLKEWLSVDIPLSHFADVVDLSMVDQLKVDGNGTVYFDNIYFFEEE